MSLLYTLNATVGAVRCLCRTYEHPAKHPQEVGVLTLHIGYNITLIIIEEIMFMFNLCVNKKIRVINFLSVELMFCGSQLKEGSAFFSFYQLCNDACY